MPRPRHPKPPIEQAVRYAEQQGWRLKMSNGHAWGRLFCPYFDRSGCIVCVWSTPRVPENHARQIRNAVDRCPHREVEESEGEGEVSE
ncbi:MAG: hypothetical protein B6D36_11695 [Planctomycetes bacterium UTPLA1]|nr:MAG: hypothetical protein B6D36_11695 [Planctomycetes bacterium UTPLA1]